MRAWDRVFQMVICMGFLFAGFAGCARKGPVSPPPLPPTATSTLPASSTPTFSPTPSSTQTPTSSLPTSTATPTSSGTWSPTPTLSPTPSPTQTLTATLTPTVTDTPPVWSPTATPTACLNPYVAATPPVACAITPVSYNAPAHYYYGAYGLAPGCKSSCANKISLYSSDENHFVGKFDSVALAGDPTYSTADWRYFQVASCPSNMSAIYFNGDPTSQYAIVNGPCGASPVTTVFTGGYSIFSGYHASYLADIAICQVSGPPGCFILTTYCGGSPTSSPTRTATNTPTLTPTNTPTNTPSATPTP